MDADEINILPVPNNKDSAILATASWDKVSQKRELSVEGIPATANNPAKSPQPFTPLDSSKTSAAKDTQPYW